MFDRSQVLVCARTKCFEGKAVNGGVVVQQLRKPDPPAPLRWVEGYKRPTLDFASASDPLEFRSETGRFQSAGSMEIFSAPGEMYRVLPHRPLFRPSMEAINLLDRFTGVERWESIGTTEGWRKLSNTHALENEIEDLRKTGWYERLRPGEWVLLGYAIEGGQGLATADDKHFLGAIRGTEAGEEHLENQALLEQRLEGEPELRDQYERLGTRGLNRETALLAMWDDLDNDALLSKRRGGRPPLWPKSATFRIANKTDIRTRPLSDDERANGIGSGPFWVPFEKGDQSQEIIGEDGRVTYLGARWTRDNPLVIDWSSESVRLLRGRARGSTSRRKPYFRNEQLWFREGVTWNRVASYLRVRQVPRTAIFSSESPTVTTTADWITPLALLALLNAPVVDFLLRTFLGSRMHLEIGDMRRIPLPVLRWSTTASSPSLRNEPSRRRESRMPARQLRSPMSRRRSMPWCATCTTFLTMLICG